jgi:hypothetical protein
MILAIEEMVTETDTCGTGIPRRDRLETSPECCRNTEGGHPVLFVRRNVS